MCRSGIVDKKGVTVEVAFVLGQAAALYRKAHFTTTERSHTGVVFPRSAVLVLLHSFTPALLISAQGIYSDVWRCW